MCQFPKYWSANPQVLAHHLGGWRKVLNLTLETAMSIVISNAFTVIEGRPVTSSRIVAEYFGKHIITSFATSAPSSSKNLL